MIKKIQSKKFVAEIKIEEKGTCEMTTLTAHVITDASVFDWQKNCYKKRLRFVEHIIRVLPKFSGNPTNSGSLTDPDDFLEVEHRFFGLLQIESILADKKTCRSCPQE